MVDRIFIGQGVGADGLAAATVSFPIMIMVMAFGMLIGFGSNALISIYLGKKDNRTAERILGQAVFLFILFSVVFTSLGLLFLTPLLKLFGASQDVLPLARQYTGIILFGVLSHEISFGCNNFIRGEGNPRVAMITMIIGAGTNIILDPIFIFGLDMGLRGAALATIIGQTIAALWVLNYYVRGRSVLKIHRDYLSIHFSLVRRVIVIGSPPFIMNIANVLIFAFINNTLRVYGGDIAISAMGIIFAVYMFIFMPIIGTSQGAQPIIGYNYGAKKYDRVKDTLQLAVKVVTLICIIGTILIQFFPKYVFLPFASGNQELISLGSHAIRIVMLMWPFVGFMIITSNYFQATARPQITLFLSLLRQVIVFLPAVLILPKFFGTDGVWYSYPISSFAAFVLSSLYFMREIKKLNAKIA